MPAKLRMQCDIVVLAILIVECCLVLKLIHVAMP